MKKNAEYKYNKYVSKITDLLKSHPELQQGGAKIKPEKIKEIKPISNSRVINYEEQNKDLFLYTKTYRKIARTPSKAIEDNDSVKITLGDPTFDSDNTNVYQLEVYNPQGEWKNEVLNGGFRHNC